MPTKVKIWVEAELVLEETVDVEFDAPEADPIVARHVQVCVDADNEDKVFLCEWEILDPDCPPDERFLRWGTDPNGMVNPIAIDLGHA